MLYRLPESERVCSGICMQTYYNFMEMDNMKKSQNAGEKLLSIRGNMGVL